MIKLYNYCKETLKFKRVLELEKMPDNYEFCSLTKIPKYNEETEYLEYSKETDTWIIKKIEKLVIDLETLKENINIKIEKKVAEIIQKKYKGRWSQYNIVNLIGGYTEELRNEYIKFANDIILQELNFKDQVNNLKTEKDIKKYSFEFTE